MNKFVNKMFIKFNNSYSHGLLKIQLKYIFI